MNTQSSILERALGTSMGIMTFDAANYFWGLRLAPKDERRASELADKARSGSLTSAEEQEIDEYRRIGRVIEMLRIRAKSVLNQPR